jgi:hypothetical protein
MTSGRHTVKVSASALAARVNRRIARRQRLARWGTALVVPTIAATIYLARWHEYFVIGGLALLVLEGIAIGSGRLLRCPFCDASLVSGRRGYAKFLDTCPDCGYLIE